MSHSHIDLSIMLESETEILKIIQSTLIADSRTVIISATLDSIRCTHDGITHTVSLKKPYREMLPLLEKLQKDGFVAHVKELPTMEIECTLTYAGLSFHRYKAETRRNNFLNHRLPLIISILALLKAWWPEILAVLAQILNLSAQ